MSNEDRPNPETERLSEPESRQLIELAIKLDAARATESSIAELRRVAEELNISPAAFDEALRRIQEQKSIDSATQATGVSLSDANPLRDRLLRVLRTVVLLTGGYLVGVLAQPGDMGRVAVLLVAVTSGLAVYDRKKRGLFSHLLEMSGVWATVMVGHLLRARGHSVAGAVDSDMILLGWIATVVLGTLLMRVSWPGKKNADPQNLTAHPA